MSNKFSSLADSLTEPEENQKRFIKIVHEELRNGGPHIKYMYPKSPLYRHLLIRDKVRIPDIQVFVETGLILARQSVSNHYARLNLDLYSQEDIIVLVAAFLKKHYPDGKRQPSTTT